MLRTILHGPQSLTAEKRRPGKGTVANLWNIISVTPGAIALVAVLVS